MKILMKKHFRRHYESCRRKYYFYEISTAIYCCAAIFYEIRGINYHFGINSLRFFAAKVWYIVPAEIKDSSSIEIFKDKIRKW